MLILFDKAHVAKIVVGVNAATPSSYTEVDIPST
jgi:hypothetical protein